MSWNNLHFINYGERLHDSDVEKPENFEKMIEITETLSKGFKVVRVDLHNDNGKIYFGEMSFTPSSGCMKFYPQKYDRIFGEHLKLQIEKDKH